MSYFDYTKFIWEDDSFIKEFNELLKCTGTKKSQYGNILDFCFSYDPAAFESVCANEVLFTNTNPRYLSQLQDYRNYSSEEKVETQSNTEYNVHTDPDIINMQKRDIVNILTRQRLYQHKKNLDDERPEVDALEEINVSTIRKGYDDEIQQTLLIRRVNYTHPLILMIIYIADRKYNYARGTNYPLIIERARRYIELQTNVSGIIDFASVQVKHQGECLFDYSLIDHMINYDPRTDYSSGTKYWLELFKIYERKGKHRYTRTMNLLLAYMHICNRMEDYRKEGLLT